MAIKDQKDRKLAELILYVAQESEGDERFGATKLNKILFYADFISYGKFRKSITDQEYQRLEWGPAPRRLVPVRDFLRSEAGGNALGVQERSRFGKTQHRFVALRDPDLSIFSGEEVDLVREVIDALWENDATSVSNLSHEFMGWGWKIAEEGETIPYEAVFLSDRDITRQEKAYAQELTATNA